MELYKTNDLMGNEDIYIKEDCIDKEIENLREAMEWDDLSIDDFDGPFEGVFCEECGGVLIVDEFDDEILLVKDTGDGCTFSERGGTFAIPHNNKCDKYGRVAYSNDTWIESSKDGIFFYYGDKKYEVSIIEWFMACRDAEYLYHLEERL